MNSHNKIGVVDHAATNSDRTQSKTTLCGHCGRRDSMWITFSIVVLVGLIIITSIIIVKTKTTNDRNTSATEESTTESTVAMKSTTEQLPLAVVVDINTHWEKYASTVAGGKGEGGESNQLLSPGGIYVDDEDQSIYVSDTYNNRIVQWKFSATNGEVVAGGHGPGSKMNQLQFPTDVILDKKDNSLIICDSENRRVVKWFRGDDKNQQIMISQLLCWGLAMDNNGDLYVSDNNNHQVRRWKRGDVNGTIVAGGNGRGNGPNQLYSPRHIFVDVDYSVYVADFFNARVMKWTENASEGILVARSQVSQSSPDYPHRLGGVIVDRIGNVYMSETTNCEITRWSPGAIKRSRVAGGFGCGGGSEHLFFASDLSFDRQGNLYVSDMGNNRIQKFAIRLN